MLDESKAIKAKDIVNDPDSVYGLTRAHILIRDESITTTFDKLLDAMDIMYDAGWEVVSFQYSSATGLVLMKNPNYKRKNG